MKSFALSKTSQKIMNGVFILSGVITFILVTILGYILVKGLPVINFEFLFLSPIDAEGRWNISCDYFQVYM